MRGGREGEGVTIKHSRREVFRVMELFCILIVVVVTQMYTCVKTHRTDYLPNPILPYDN